MKNHAAFQVPFALFALLLSSAVFAQQVLVSSGDQFNISSQAKTSVSTTCASGTYTVVIDPAIKKVTVSVASEKNVTSDITNSTAGQLFLNANMYGQTKLACTKDSARVVFAGFMVTPENKKVEVTYGIYINGDGTVRDNAKLHVETSGNIAYRPNA